MTGLLTIILLTLLQMLSGLGLFSCLGIRLKPGLKLPLWILSGVALFSLIPFVLQLLYIPLTGINIFLALAATTLLLNIRYKRSIGQCKVLIKDFRFRIRLYEIPFIVVTAAIVLISVWRCFYLPPTPRDLTSGAEVIAEYAVREKTMINSVFSVNLETTNNQFKPPFITSLQIIYKYAGFPFGQIWLSTIFICLIAFMYAVISHGLHRLIAWLFLLIFLAIPEMYAYTFMTLFDYSNAVYFFLSIYFVLEYFRHGQRNQIVMAGILMGFATYIRSETLILGCLASTLIAWHHFKNKDALGKLLLAGIWFLLPGIIVYLVSVSLYINHYLPVTYDVKGLVNDNLTNLDPLLNRFIAVNRDLIFSKDGIQYYGYFIFIFLAIVLADAVLSRRLSTASKNWLFAVLVVYLGLPVLGYLFPLMDINNSTKRGMFKIFPLMLMYMSTSPVINRISEKIKRWEEQ